MMRRDDRGFTLIELLIVVVIIGILAMIAMPKFESSKEQAYVSRMRGDLRNLAVAQEGYASDNGGAFFNGAVPDPALIFTPTSGVSIALSNVTATGWGATATFPAHTGRSCAFYVGTGGPLGPATSEGQVVCD